MVKRMELNTGSVKTHGEPTGEKTDISGLLEMIPIGEDPRDCFNIASTGLLNMKEETTELECD